MSYGEQWQAGAEHLPVLHLEVTVVFYSVSILPYFIFFDRADVNLANRGTLLTPIHSAAYQGHGKVIMKLMEYNPDVTLKDNEGRLVVHVVCIYKIDAKGVEHAEICCNYPKI